MTTPNGNVCCGVPPWAATVPYDWAEPVSPALTRVWRGTGGDPCQNLIMELAGYPDEVARWLEELASAVRCARVRPVAS